MTQISILDDPPSYSTPALNVLRHFYECEVLIFVEGNSDILFWHVIAQKAGLINTKIESVGGNTQIKKKINQIIDEDAKIIVACDLDHSPFIDGISVHPQIVKTYGYSIENTMYCPASLNRFLKKLSRQLKIMDNSTGEWLSEFVKQTKTLLIYDIANHRYNKESRFLEIVVQDF